MYLEYWMIAVILAFFGIGLYHMYRVGYSTAYVTGGIYGHMTTMEIVKKVVSADDLQKIRDSIISMQENKSSLE